MSENDNKFWCTWVNNYWQIVTFCGQHGDWVTHVRDSDGKEDYWFAPLIGGTIRQAHKNHSKALQYVLDGYNGCRERPIVRWEETGHAWENI